MVISEIFIEDPYIADPCPKCSKPVTKISYERESLPDIYLWQSHAPVRSGYSTFTYALHHKVSLIDTPQPDMCFMDDPQFSFEVRANKDVITRLRFKYKGKWTTNRRFLTW